MANVKLTNTTNAETILKNIKFCTDFRSRLIGLMGKKNLNADEGLVIEPCNSIHTFFMRFNIDIAFLDDDNKVVGIIYGMKPWRMSRIVINAKKVVEVNDGVFKGKVVVGDILKFI